MKVTLKSICQRQNYSAFELLTTKKELLRYKQQGRLFFDCNIARLNWEDEFDIYFHMLSNKESEINAFPVPLNQFQLHTNQQIQSHYLKEYFERYYEGNRWKDEWFRQYNEQKPFVGEKFVWYFKRRECFS